jgi:hypothetical protein
VKRIGATMLAALAVAATPAWAAVTIGTQIVDTQLRGTVAATPLASDGSDAATRAGSISASAQIVAPGGGVSAVRATSSILAVLTNAERGRVTFRRSLTPGVDDAIQSSSANYRYFFTTDAPVAFDVNWGVAAFGTGPEGGVPGQALSLAVRGTADTLLRLGALGDGASGATQVLLAPGSYELRIEDTFALVAGPGTRTGLSSQYSFTMRAVPEPATWMLLLLGFGAVGVALRRRIPRLSECQIKPRSRG